MAVCVSRIRFTCSVLNAAILPFLLASGAARAADPQPYTVAIAATGSSELDKALGDSALLVSLKDKAPAPPFGLIARANADVGRLVQVLNGFGYEKPAVKIAIAGHDVADPDLPQFLDGVAARTPVAVKIAIDKGPLYRWREIAVTGTVPAQAKAALALVSGAPAIAADAVAAQTRLLNALREEGYALARVSDPIAYADDEAHMLDIHYEAEAGPQAEIGAISFKGLKAVNEDFARRVMVLRSGDRYRPSAIENARLALLATGVFSGVTVRAADRLSADGRLPVVFDVEERPRHAVALSGDYATDLGFTLSTSWSDRNLLGNAEQLNLTAAANGLGGSATAALGYKIGAQFLKPMAWRPDQIFELDLGTVKQSLEAYDQRAETLGLVLKRKLSPQWNGSVGFTLAQDDIAQEGTARSYQLLQLPLAAGFDSTGLPDPLRDATHGVRVSLALTPTFAVGAHDPVFLILQASASAYFDLSGDGRSVLAARALAGSVQGASNLDLPPDQRLYAGGSATVRGFKYQSIGPSFADGNPVGGSSVDAATIEFRQRLFGDFGAAAFVDAGQASAQSLPFTGTLRVGAGGGARYYTPIGVVRADIAIPLTPVPDGNSFELYIGLGQVF